MLFNPYISIEWLVRSIDLQLNGQTFWCTPIRYTEPAIDYSGGLILALSALVHYHTGLGPYNECGLNFGYAFSGAPAPPDGLVAACGLTSVAAGNRTAVTLPSAAGPSPGVGP